MINERDLFVQCTHEGMKSIMDKMIVDPKDPDYGFRRFTEGDDMGGAVYACIFMHFIVCYYTEGIGYYRDPLMLTDAECTLDRLDRFVYEDGSMDLLETNMHDPTYVAFNVRDYLGPSLELMTKFSLHTKEEDRLFHHLTATLKKMADAMKHLGFHTPNHRWIICAALSYIYKFMGDEEALEVINRFLMEGLDCDENGEYTERSTGCYNEVCNRSFLQMYHLWKDPKYLDCVIRNMRLVDSFIEPDDTVCTMNSMRQDKAYNVKRDIYAMIYLPLALYTGDPEFAYYAEKMYRNLEADCLKADGPVPTCILVRLYWFLVEPDFIGRQSEIVPVKPEHPRNVFLPRSGMARIYNGNTTLSVSCGNMPDFFKFQVGSASLYARAGCSFFGQPHAQFRPQKMEKTEKGFRLTAHEEAGYRSQLEEPPATSEWRMMDHSKRKLINRQSYDAVIDIVPTEDGFEMDAHVECTGRVPFKIEFQFTPGLLFTSETLSFCGKSDGYVYYKGGKLYVHFGKYDIYEISGGGADYLLSEDMRGTEHVRGGCFALCINGHAPVSLHFAMKKVDLKTDPRKVPYCC